MSQKSYLIVGASGTVGSELVRNLKNEGHSVITTTHKKEKTNAHTRYIDLVSGEGREAAFEGVGRAFFLSPGGYADQYQILSPLILEAKKKNLEKVVLMSAMGADANDETPLRRAELELIRSEIPYNIIRPNWFMQNFNTFWVAGIKEQGKIMLPVSNSKTSFIDARDISAVAAKLLISDKWNNKDFVLTGPESLDHNQVASLISEVTGKKVQFEDIEPAPLRSGLISAGLPADYTDFLLMILGYVKAGYNAPMTDNVNKILGREPGNFISYARDYKSSWV